MYLGQPKRNGRGSSLAEFGPAFVIAVLVILFIVGVGFYICGVTVAYFACQLAAREGATGGSRDQCRTAAITAANRVATGPFGQFANVASADGGPFTDGLQVRFFQVDPTSGNSSEFTGGGVNTNLVYQIRVESNYRLSVPFIGNVPGQAAADNIVEHPEGLAL